MPFGYSSPPKEKTSVSCVLFTAVHSRIHITFPVPFTLATFPSLANGIGTDSRQFYVLAHRLFNRSSAPPDCSRRTYSQGHFVPEVVLVEKQDTESGYALFCRQSSGPTFTKLYAKCGVITTENPPTGGYFVANSPSRANSRRLIASN